MSIADAPALYEAAVRGEPLQRAVFPPPLNTNDDFWTLGDWPIKVPRPVPQVMPDLERIVKEVREWTGWSARRLADVVESTHTTILRAENGRPLMPGHSGDLRERLFDLHNLVERVFLVVGRDSERTAAVLSTSPPNRRSAADEFRATADPGRAYIAAIDVMRPRRPGLLVGDRPRQDGPTTALHE